MQCSENCNCSLFFYLFPEGPDGILSVFCKLNLPGGTFSADWDKLMLRFLKNSNPPLELGSCGHTQHTVVLAKDALWVYALKKLYNSATNLSCRCGGRGLSFSRTNGFKKSNHMSTQVPFALFQCCVEQEGGMLPANCRDFHILHKEQGRRQSIYRIQFGRQSGSFLNTSLSPRS